MSGKPRGRPPAVKKRKVNEQGEFIDSQNEEVDSQEGEFTGELELAGTESGTETGTETGTGTGAEDGAATGTADRAVGGTPEGAVGGAAGGAVGGAVIDSIAGSGTRTPAGAMETGQVTGQERAELARVIGLLDQRNSRTGREPTNTQGTNSTRISRASSPTGNVARLHQENLNRWEALGARQTNVENEMVKMSTLLVDLRREMTKMNESLAVQTKNMPNGNQTGDRLGNLTEKVNQNGYRDTGAIPKRNTRSTMINNAETPENYQSEFARTLNQTIGGTIRPNSGDRDGEVVIDNFDRFYNNNRTISGPPTVLTTPVTRNETYRYEQMYHERERERRELRDMDEQIIRNSNLTQLSIQNRIQNPRANLNPRQIIRDENLPGGSRLEGNNPQSGPRVYPQNIMAEGNSNVGAGPDDANDSKHAGQMLRNCPEWTGPSSGVTFRDWIQSMKNRFLFGPPLSDEWKKLMVYEKLKDVARTMAGEEMNPGIETNLNIKNDRFEDYVAKLAEKLDPAQNLQRLKDQLENRKQRADEPVDFYLLSVTNQWKKIYTIDEQSRSEIRENLCKVFKNSLINPMLRRKAREFHMYLKPPNDYEQLHKAILTEARLIREMINAGDLSSDKEVGTKEHLDYVQYKGENTKNNPGKLNSLNSIEEGDEDNCEVNFVKKGNWNKGVGQSFQKGRSFKPNNRFFRFSRLKNQNIGMKGRCFWCGDANHFVRDCPRKAKGLDRTVNGLNLEEECLERGYCIDEDGMICVEGPNEEEREEPISFEPDPQVNAFAQNRQNVKKNDNRRKGGYFKKRQAKFKKNNQFRTVTVISHYDENDKLLSEVIEDEEEAQESTEIQSLDLNEIFENNFTIGALDYEGEVDEGIFTELENNTGLEEIFSDNFATHSLINSLEDDENILERLSLEENQISELDCEKLNEYF